ncbi:M16 family metallopeptidase [Azovibrio restrictus]|uniref:M16 family metallopeptidase n=1 Tax=Azovibrio restrictus TaxID=146938 RepID=UPI00041639C3|nr:pitrilysin family protein [Azovibrio restrictus]
MSKQGSTPRLFSLSALFLAGSLLFGSAHANPFETTLANGLKVVVKEDHRAPVVAHMVWYRVGSMDEVDGTSGVAHLLEHMMFKGTPKVGPGEFSKRVAAAGGRDNAFTSRDYTAYFQQIPKERLGEMMALEADRMRHLNVDPKEFAQEIKVVMEERRLRTEDEPQSLLFEQAHAVAYQAHPYRRPIIGWMNDLENMTARDAKAWYDQWYVPNNAILVVSGDVQHEQVFKLARQYYGPLKSRALPARKPQVEPLQKGVRRLVVKGPAELPLLLLGWKAPKVERLDGPVEPFALDMLAAILDGHDAARLGRSLVREQQLATSVGASYDGLNRGPAMFYLYGSPAPGQTPETLEKALRGELARIARDGVDEGELKRAKAQLIAAQVYKLDSVFGQAMEIGSMEVIGFSHKDVAALQARLEAVTAAQVQAAAQAWFGDDTLTVGLLEPLPPEAAPKGPKAAPAGRHH